MFLGSYFVNDLQQINKPEILKKVKESTRFSVSFLLLLIGSSVVCTLGLILNSTAIVIGGMIISPLMWPLMQTSLGISYGRPAYIRRALVLLIFATLVSLLSAFLITYLSPIKVVNEEIISRANPTLINMVIALVAGAVAALAITQPKISESLAGVAVAVSLMPPLAVSGIGLALFEMEVFIGGILLFVANVVSIIFASIIVFIAIGMKNATEPTFQKRAITVLALVLFLTSIPLFLFLREFSFETVAYSASEKVLTEGFSSISPSIYVSNIKTSVLSGENKVLVEAEVLLPEDMVISHEERQDIKDRIEKLIGKPVDLTLRLQKTISVVTQTDIDTSAKKRFIEDSFVKQVELLNPDLTVDTLEVYYDESLETWQIKAVLRGDPSILLSLSDQEKIKSAIEEVIDGTVIINLEIISRVKLQTSSDEFRAQVKLEIQDFLNAISDDIIVNSIKITQNGDNYDVVVEVKAPTNVPLTNNSLSLLRTILNDKFEKEFNITFSIISINKLSS